MTSHLGRRLRKALVVALLGAALAVLSVAAQHHPTAAQASVPSAIEIADHALNAPVAVEDEGSYRLIDPVGPGGLTRQAAIGEVVASTMQGGSYGDRQYFGHYGQQIYVPPAQPPHSGANPAPQGGGWGGHRR